VANAFSLVVIVVDLICKSVLHGSHGYWILTWLWLNYVLRCVSMLFLLQAKVFLIYYDQVY
jgi:hypothetical protein